MSTQNKIIAEKLYKLDILYEWADGDEVWLAGFIELLLIEIPKKIEIIQNAYSLKNLKKLAYELHQLSSQLSLLHNDEINKLLKKVEKRAIKELPMNDIDILIDKSYNMLSELKSDFNL